MLSCVRQDAFGDMKTTHSGRTNQDFNVPCLLQDERVLQNGSIASGSKTLVRPEQKSMVWIKVFTCKFALLEMQIVIYCAGTFPVAKACMLLLHCRRFFGCDPDLEWVASSLPQMAPIFARQVLNEASDITGDDDVQQAATTFIKVMEELELNIATMYAKRQLVFLQRKHFRCIYFAILYIII